MSTPVVQHLAHLVADAAPVLTEVTRQAVDVSINILRHAGNFTAFVYHGTGAILAISPATDDPHASVEVARTMVSTGCLILTPELDAVWGTA